MQPRTRPPRQWPLPVPPAVAQRLEDKTPQPVEIIDWRMLADWKSRNGPIRWTKTWDSQGRPIFEAISRFTAPETHTV